MQQTVSKHTAQKNVLIMLFFGTASKLASFSDNFLPNCFGFLVLYTA